MEPAGTSAEAWRRCSTCKRWIGFEATHYTCSVSTCNQRKTAFVFCSEGCWDAHVPTLRHRESWAIEAKAPTAAAWARAREEAAAEGDASEDAGAPRRRIVARTEPAPAASGPTPREVLVVVSRLKAYVQARADMNTADAVAHVLSDVLRDVCDEAIRNARRDGRRTVLERDVPRWTP